MFCEGLQIYLLSKYIGLMEIKIWILILMLTWIPLKKLNSPRRCEVLRDFENQEYRVTIPNPAQGWQKNSKNSVMTYTGWNAVIYFIFWCGNFLEKHNFCTVSGNCAFPQNYHTRKLGEITVFFTALDVCVLNL